MSITRFAVPLLAAAALLPVVPAVAAADGLSWQLCATVAKGWDPDDRRTECAQVAVPVDYADPGGRKIDIAVSRIRATGTRTGAILLNPGGPGQSGLTMPGSIADSHAGGLGVHHDLIGFDPRGVGYSADLPCPTELPDPGITDEEKAREAAERAAEANRKCVEAHPAFVRNLTTPTIARDLDRIRVALGEDKIGYYGVSWGTALGAQYRSLFDDHVDRMLLDSVMPPDLSVTAMDDGQATAGENTFHEFAAWIARYDAIYRFGTMEPAVAKALLGLRDRHGAAVNDMPGLGRRAARVQPLPADGAALQRVAEPARLRDRLAAPPRPDESLPGRQRLRLLRTALRRLATGRPAVVVRKRDKPPAAGRPPLRAGHAHRLGARDAAADRRRAHDRRGRRPRLAVVAALRRRRGHFLRHGQDDVGVVPGRAGPGAVSQRFRSWSRTSMRAKPSRFSPRQ